MNMSCDNARSLVPSYLDGELSEAQAAPLRGHLFDCPACRELAKDGRALERWFEAALEVRAVEVPPGFAARVARRAFAGDPGRCPELAEPAGLRPAGTLLSFLLGACAVAAGLLLVLALAIQRQTLPPSNGLDAQVRPPWLSSSAPAARPAELPPPAKEEEEPRGEERR